MKTWLIALAISMTTVAGAQSPIEAAVKDLRSAARGKNEDATMTAADRVVQLGKDAAPFLMAGISELSGSEILWTVRTLKVMQAGLPTATVEALGEHSDPLVRAEVHVYARQTLGRDAIPLHARGLEDQDLVVRRRALDGLAAHGDAVSLHLGKVLEVLTTSDFWLVGKGLEVVVAAAPREGPASVAFLRDVEAVYPRLDPSAVGPLTQAVASSYGDRFGPYVERLLRRARGPHLVAAIEAAVALRLKDAPERLAELALDMDDEVSLAAVKALGLLEARKSALTLVSVLQRGSTPEIRDAALVSLRQITGLLIGPDPSAWRDGIRSLDR